MSKSAAHKVTARKARNANPTMASKGTVKARDKHQKTARKIAAGKMRNTSRDSQTPSKGTVKARDKHQKTAPVAAEKMRKTARETAPKVTTETVRHAQPKTATQFEQFRGTHVPDTLRAIAERNVAQTRELYERSHNTLKAVLDSWQDSFGAAGRGTVALNRKITDIAERNINTGFDLAMGLTRAKSFAEAMELQAAYWRKLFGASGR